MNHELNGADRPSSGATFGMKISPAWAGVAPTTVPMSIASTSVRASADAAALRPVLTMRSVWVPAPRSAASNRVCWYAHDGW